MHYNTKDEEYNEKQYNEYREKKYKELNLDLEQIQKKRKGKNLLSLCFLAAIILGVLVFCVILGEMDYKVNSTAIIVSIIVAIIAGISTYLSESFYFEIKENNIKREMLVYESANIQEEVKEDIFENSIKMSYKYLDQYYLQTREQAQKGFLVTVYVAVFGAILIGSGIIAMFLEKTSPAYITCASGVVTEFIAAVFFYLYNRTITSMSKYHNKLVLSQNISIALKVSDTLPSDDKVKAKNQIITELLKDVNSYLIKSDSGEKENG